MATEPKTGLIDESEPGRTTYMNDWMLDYPYYMKHSSEGCIDSPKFTGTSTCDEKFKIIWYYRLTPTKVRNGTEYMEIDTIIELSEKVFPVELAFKMFPTESRQTREIVARGLTKRRCTIPTIRKSSASFWNTLKSGKIAMYFYFTLIEEDGAQETYSSWESAKFPKPPSELVQNLSDMLTNKTLVDIKIIVGQQEFSAHKSILASRSSVFAAMFEHGMLEYKQNLVTITDIEPKAFQELLRYIYTDEVNMEGLALELLAAADKYALDRLKSMCEGFLFENLTLTSATETLVCADLYGAVKLKKETLRFIQRNFKRMFETNWTTFCMRHPTLAGDIMNELMKSPY